jgi:hypothetical protein
VYYSKGFPSDTLRKRIIIVPSQEEVIKESIGIGTNQKCRNIMTEIMSLSKRNIGISSRREDFQKKNQFATFVKEKTIGQISVLIRKVKPRLK